MPTHIIPVVSAIGSGSNSASAYDAALRQAGCADRNVLALSSVIPPGWRPSQRETAHIEGRWGDRLYAVQARAFTGTPGLAAAAGLAWVLLDNGAGLFVEGQRHGRLQTLVEDLQGQLHAALDEMVGGRGANEVERGHCVMATDEAQPDDPIYCALVIAPYDTEPWRK